MTHSIDDILAVLKEWAENKIPVDPGAYLEAGMKLISLVGVENDRLFELESEIAQFKEGLMDDPAMTAAKAKIKAEASPQYLTARKLKSKIETIHEMVKLAKVRARMGSDEFRGN